MPVATRSHSVTSPRALRNRLRGDQNQNQQEQEHHESSVMRIPHYKLKEKMKSIAQANENTNTTTRPQNQPFKTSHASVDLLSPQVTSLVSAEKRKLRVSMEKNPEKIESNAVQVLGQCNWVREQRGRDSSLDRLGFSCQKPAPTGNAGVARRLTMIGVANKETKSLGGLMGGQLETIAEGKSGDHGTRIMVYVRLRPMSRKEKDAGSTSCVRVVNKRDVYITEYGMETDYLRLKRVKGRHFAFDVAFPDTTGQEEVYSTTTADLVEGVLQGRNGSVFCYGATGAGKTYTMLGTIQNPGVMVLAIKDLFMKLRQRSCDGHHVVRLSYLEVYNETVRDLLSPGRPLVLREDKQGIVAAGLTQYQAYSTDEVMALLQQGNQNRTTEPTRMNETSSRSHAILQVVAEYKVKESSTTITRAGKLSLIDLAGSERALATDLRTLRSLEGANINRSLLALSSCINALVEGKKHIPYRNSKLTQLLKDSLGGACHTVMIANISPCIQTFGETQNTLHWADRAKEIRTKASIAHEEFQPPESQSEQLKLLLEVQKENQQLRMQIARYQQKILSLQSQCVTSSPALSSSSVVVPASPLTPAPIEIQMIERHHSKINQCSTPEPTPRRTSFHDGGKPAEEVIKDLKRKIRTLEMDNQNLNNEFSIKEKKLKASIVDLKREHNLQLKQKDDFIRKLCQKSSVSNKPEQKSPSPLQKDETLNFTQPNENTNALKSTILIPSSSAKLPSERPRKSMLATMQGRNTNSLPQNVHEAGSFRMGRRVQCPSEAGSLKSPCQSNRFRSPGPAAVGSKRTFWDITNANSPSAKLLRSTRTHRTDDAPSMLLQ
ncbi:hypothetical protein KI387_015068, partial [Taxus chinensis]